MRRGGSRVRGSVAGLPLCSESAARRREGRHAVALGPRWRRAGLALGAVVVMLVAGGWVVAGRMACANPAAVRVVADPAIAPLVDRVARDLTPGGCAEFTVQPRGSTDEAQSLALADGSEPAQVWIPESSLALARARYLGATGVPGTGPSIAGSPVVMALTADAVHRVGRPGARPTWPDVLGDDAVTVGVPDPTRTAVGLAALLSAQAETRTAPDLAAGFTATLRRLAAHTTVDADDLYAQLPGAPGVGAPVTAFATSEQALLRHNVTRPGEPLTAAYPATGAELDYPFAVLDSATAGQRDAAQRLLRALQSPDGQAALADGGFRTPAGAMLRDRSADGRTAATVASPVPVTATDDATEVLTRWATVNRSARVRVLIDVSGSMNAVVPSLGITRLAATLQAAEAGLRLFQPTTRLGYWTFSTELDGDRDYREVVPMSPVRDLLTDGALDTLRAIRAKPGGATGLNDTVLAAYREAQANWEPGRLNLVIVMTDGNDDDPGGISRAQLLGALKAAAVPGRPVVLIGVAIGPDVDPTELDQITAATGGKSFVAADPAKIKDVFFGALATLKPS